MPARVSERVVDNLTTAVLLTDHELCLRFVNPAAEMLLQLAASKVRGRRLADLLAPGQQLLDVLHQALAERTIFTARGLELGLLSGQVITVDCTVSPLTDTAADPELLVELAQVDRLLRLARDDGIQRAQTANRALIAGLAHEIKNPLSGIRGAAQLLEADADENGRTLTRLICDEADRIVGLVDRMEVFADERPMPREPVNIHVVLGRVKTLAASGFARGIRFREDYDPSLPPIHANRDQLLQVFINLVKNAAEAIAGKENQEIVFQTAYRPGIRISVPGSAKKVSLPLEISITDSGPGVPDDMLPYLFDPFVTSKANGTGLGLALVAKIVGDHGGVIECKSQPNRTTFRLLMPVHSGTFHPDFDHPGTAGESEPGDRP